MFTNGNSLRFTKDQIDGVCKDLRYPSEFFIDIIFDNDKNIQSNNFEEDVVKWKNIISDFIVKGYKNNVITSNEPNSTATTVNNPVPLIIEPLKENKDIINTSNVGKQNKESNSSIIGTDNSGKNAEKIYIEEKTNINKEEKIQSEYSEKQNHLDVDLEHEEEEGHHATTNTLEQANEILQKFNQGKNEANASNNEEDEEEEDLDDYIKNLENKA